MKTHDELKQIAVDMVDGKIFSDRHIQNKTDIGMVFMPLMFGAFKEISEEDMKNGAVQIVYEYLDQAGPRSINGYPIFTSLRYLNFDETKIMFDYYEKYAKLKKEFNKFG